MFVHYQCNKCNYEFDFFIQPHPHTGATIFQLGQKGCLICLKAQAMEKTCPKCGSNDLTQTVAEKMIIGGIKQ